MLRSLVAPHRELADIQIGCAGIRTLETENDSNFEIGKGARWNFFGVRRVSSSPCPWGFIWSHIRSAFAPDNVWIKNKRDSMSQHHFGGAIAWELRTRRGVDSLSAYCLCAMVSWRILPVVECCCQRSRCSSSDDGCDCRLAHSCATLENVSTTVFAALVALAARAQIIADRDSKRWCQWSSRSLSTPSGSIVTIHRASPTTMAATFILRTGASA